MRRIAFVILILAFVVSLPKTTLADLIFPNEFGTTFQVFNPASATSDVFFGYDSTTNLFSFGGSVGIASSSAVIDAFPLSAPFDIDDLIGTFSLTAEVDETGTTLGGVFSLVGESATLGTGLGDVLLSGTVESVEFILDDFVGAIFQIIATVNYTDAALEGLYGDPDQALIVCAACPPALEFIADPWTVDSPLSVPATQNPNIYVSTLSVPEPGTLALLVIGLSGIGLARRKQP